MFLMTCEQLHVDAHECVYVDDQPRHVAVAHRLGMKTISYQSAHECIQQLKKAVAI